MNRYYPAIARRFPELNALQDLLPMEANEIRTDAYKALYDKLPIQEKALADRTIKELQAIIPIKGFGDASAWELLVALAQAMEWLDWPER